MKKYNTICLALLLSIAGSAQTIKKYSGQLSKPEWISELFESEYPYDINGYYSYYEDANENRIIHGEFMISYRTGTINNVDKYEIRGSYSHGRRVGKWEMKAKLINGEYAQDYLYQFNYRDGLLNGLFSFYSPDMQDVEITGQFKNGVISDNVIIRQHCALAPGKCYTQVEGMVNDKGNPHGVWIEKEVSEKAIPKDITRLYYDGNLVYRREKDLSSGKIVYTYSVSDEIRVPADMAKISDTIIKGKEYLKVGTMICVKDKDLEFYSIEGRFADDMENEDKCVLYGVIRDNCPMMAEIYPSIKNWRTRLDSHSYVAVVKREQEEEQRRKEEKIREEERKQWEEERTINNLFQGTVKHIGTHCFGSDAKNELKRLYKEGGIEEYERVTDSIIRYEYEHYTIGELGEKTKDFYLKNSINKIQNKAIRNKKLKWKFHTYEDYYSSILPGTLNQVFDWMKSNP